MSATTRQAPVDERTWSRYLDALDAWTDAFLRLGLAGASDEVPLPEAPTAPVGAVPPGLALRARLAVAALDDAAARLGSARRRLDRAAAYARPDQV